MTPLALDVVEPDEVADATAARIAGLIAGAVARRGRCAAAFSGGRTPESMLRALAALDLPWSRLDVVQVDERVAPDGHPDRNLTLLRQALVDPAPIPAANVHPMPVTDADLPAAATRYAALLNAVCGEPPALDVVHLGLGDDGHTASLIPRDPVLDVADSDVAIAGPYQGRLRMTLTLPALNRARAIVWQVAGAGKARALEALLNGEDIPAARIRRDSAVVVADRQAARLISP